MLAHALTLLRQPTLGIGERRAHRAHVVAAVPVKPTARRAHERSRRANCEDSRRDARLTDRRDSRREGRGARAHAQLERSPLGRVRLAQLRARVRERGKGTAWVGVG